MNTYVVAPKSLDKTCGVLHRTTVHLLPQHPKDPGMSWERDFPYNPMVGMGLGPSI